MRKGILAAATLLLALQAPAMDLRVGCALGTRSVDDERLREAYGPGTVYFPYAALSFWKGAAVGAGLETGYSKEANLGLYKEASSLKIQGFEIFALYQVKFDALHPYLKAGYGFYSYSQTLDSPIAPLFKVDARQGAPILAGGFNLHMTEGLYLSGEVKYVPLKVKPFDEEVDLGGLRYLLGLGYAFKF